MAGTITRSRRKNRAAYGLEKRHRGKLQPQLRCAGRGMRGGSNRRRALRAGSLACQDANVDSRGAVGSPEQDSCYLDPCRSGWPAGQDANVVSSAAVGPTRRLVAWIPQCCRPGWLPAAGQGANGLLTDSVQQLWALLEDWWPAFLKAAGLAAC